MSDVESGRAAALRSCAILDTAADPAFDDIVWLAAQSLQAPIAFIAFAEDHRHWFKASLGLDNFEFTGVASFASAGIGAGTEVFVVEDAAADARFAENPLVQGPDPVRFFAGAPVRIAGASIGVIGVADRAPRPLSPAGAAALVALARQTSRAVTQHLLDRLHPLAEGGGPSPADRAAGPLRGLRTWIYVDSLGVIRMVERCASRLWTDPETPIDGLPLRTLLARIGAEAQVADAVEAALVDGQRRCQILELALGGELALLDARVHVLRGASGTTVGALLLLRDVTEAQQLEEEVRQSIVSLEARNQLQEQMIHILSHDLREPIIAVTNFAGLLADEAHPVSADTSRTYARYIRDNGQRLKLLVEDLRAYVALDRHSGSQMRLSLAPLVAEVLAELDEPIRAAGAIVTVHELPEVRGSRMLLALLLNNLLTNAMKFVAPGVSPRIEIGGSANAAGWELCVSDNGIGIEPRHQGVVFDLFRRLHPRERYAGTGMGLALCRRIAELHRGYISLESTAGVGSRFVLRVPSLARPPGRS